MTASTLAVGERDRLRRAGERLDTRYGPLELGAHRVDRLDRDDAGAQRDELPRELAGARREVEHVAPGPMPSRSATHATASSG